MSEKKLERNFNRTAVDAQIGVETRISTETAKLRNSETYKSANHVLISMDKLVDLLPDQQLNAVKEHIDNVYYHAGVIKGCAK